MNNQLHIKILSVVLIFITTLSAMDEPQIDWEKYRLYKPSQPTLSMQEATALVLDNLIFDYSQKKPQGFWNIRKGLSELTHHLDKPEAASVLAAASTFGLGVKKSKKVVKILEQYITTPEYYEKMKQILHHAKTKPEWQKKPKKKVSTAPLAAPRQIDLTSRRTTVIAAHENTATLVQAPESPETAKLLAKIETWNPKKLKQKNIAHSMRTFVNHALEDSALIEPVKAKLEKLLTHFETENNSFRTKKIYDTSDVLLQLARLYFVSGDYENMCNQLHKAKIIAQDETEETLEPLLLLNKLKKSGFYNLLAESYNLPETCKVLLSEWHLCAARTKKSPLLGTTYYDEYARGLQLAQEFQTPELVEQVGPGLVNLFNEYTIELLAAEQFTPEMQYQAEANCRQSLKLDPTKIATHKNLNALARKCMDTQNYAKTVELSEMAIEKLNAIRDLDINDKITHINQPLLLHYIRCAEATMMQAETNEEQIEYIKKCFDKATRILLVCPLILEPHKIGGNRTAICEQYNILIEQLSARQHQEEFPTVINVLFVLAALYNQDESAQGQELHQLSMTKLQEFAQENKTVQILLQSEALNTTSLVGSKEQKYKIYIENLKILHRKKEEAKKKIPVIEGILKDLELIDFNRLHTLMKKLFTEYKNLLLILQTMGETEEIQKLEQRIDTHALKIKNYMHQTLASEEPNALKKIEARSILVSLYCMGGEFEKAVQENIAMLTVSRTEFEALRERGYNLQETIKKRTSATHEITVALNRVLPDQPEKIAEILAPLTQYLDDDDNTGTNKRL